MPLINSTLYLLDIDAKPYPLKLIINNKVDKLILKIENDKSVLNFEDIKLYGANNELVGNGAIINYSTPDPYQYLSEKIYKAGLVNQYCSSEVDEPFYEIDFKNPIELGGIELFNRPGKLGYRLLNVRVTGLLNDTFVFDYYNTSEKAFQLKKIIIDKLIINSTYLNKLIHQDSEISYLYEQFIKFEYSNLTNANEIINSLKHKLFKSILRSPPTNDAILEVSNFLRHLINRYATANTDTLDYQLTALYFALNLFYEINFKAIDLNFQYSLVRFNNFYKNKQDLHKLQYEVNEIIFELTKHRGVIITRHGFKISPLVVHKKTYLDLMDRLFVELIEMDLKPFIAYGTLLGAKRNSHFIEFDDDVDIGIIFEVIDMGELSNKLKKITEDLVAKGFDVIHNIEFNIIQLINVIPSSIDIFGFPRIIKGNSYVQYGMHGAMTYDVMQDGVLTELDTIELEGRFFSSPKNPDKFLVWRYGENWMHPDQFFEMDWILSF